MQVICKFNFLYHSIWADVTLNVSLTLWPASGGISIPASYSAHFTPIMAPKIHADISSRKNDSEAAETPYVVMLQSFEILAEQGYIHRAWEFTHPLPPNVLSDSAALSGGLIGLGDGGNDHNARKCKATFKVPRRGVVHGLAGYFESVLYGDVELSTRPDTIDMKSKDMISWFPIFFPLKVRKVYLIFSVGFARYHVGGMDKAHCLRLIAAPPGL